MVNLIIPKLLGVVGLGSGSSVYCCPFDGLPCDRFIDDVGFGACYVKSVDGVRLKSVCPRFVANPNVCVVEDLVRKGLAPK
jgi:hypothetical protein